MDKASSHNLYHFPTVVKSTVAINTATWSLNHKHVKLQEGKIESQMLSQFRR